MEFLFLFYARRQAARDSGKKWDLKASGTMKRQLSVPSPRFSVSRPTFSEKHPS
jgi:hypothetical protein